jgi:hypothetical protein
MVSNFDKMRIKSSFFAFTADGLLGDTKTKKHLTFGFSSNAYFMVVTFLKWHLHLLVSGYKNSRTKEVGQAARLECYSAARSNFSTRSFPFRI